MMKHREDMKSGSMTMEEMYEEIPVDMYGHRVFTDKSEGNLKKVEEDIHELYGF